MLLDVSASMAYGSHKVNKLDYARYLAASIALSIEPAARCRGIIIFDDEVRNYVPPSARQGQFARMLHAIEKAEPGTRTELDKPFFHCQAVPAPPRHHCRGLGFLRGSGTRHQAMEPAAFHGNEMILFHILDPQEIRPPMQDPVLVARHGNQATRSKSRPNTCGTNIAKRSTRISKALQDTGATVRNRLLFCSTPVSRWMTRCAEYLIVAAGEG